MIVVILAIMPWASGVTNASSWPYLHRISCLQPPYHSLPFFIPLSLFTSLLPSVVLCCLKGFGSGPETSRCTLLSTQHRVTFSPAVHPPLTALTFTYSTAPVISHRNGLQTAHRLCIHADTKPTKGHREKAGQRSSNTIKLMLNNINLTQGKVQQALVNS